MSEQGMNRVTLIGRLGSDPELRYTQSNQGVLNFRMATSESYFDKNSKERKEKVEWHSVVIWGARGEALNKILTKGSRICVEGKLQTRSWETKDNEKRYSTEIVGLNVILLGGKSGERGDSASHGSDDHTGGGGYEQGYESSGSTDDIPFISSGLSSKETVIGEAWNHTNSRLI